MSVNKTDYPLLIPHHSLVITNYPSRILTPFTVEDYDGDFGIVHYISPNRSALKTKVDTGTLLDIL